MLVFCVASLLALGMVMLYSASMVQVGAHYLLMQLVWGGFGLLAMFVAARIDYRLLRKAVWPLFVVALVLIGVVLHPNIGHAMNGARRWFHFGMIRFQPSELAKLALIVMLAWYGERHQRHMSDWKRGILVPGLAVAPMLGLIFVEPDRGTTILLAAVTALMLLIAGVQWKFFLPPFVLAGVGLGFSLLHDPMRIKRIMAWLYLEENKTNAGYQAYQAMLALGSGGWFGLGLGNGRQKLGFIPEHHTDFIFSIMGEELGLAATLFVVLAFLLILFCGLYISVRARDTFGMLLGSGLTFMIGLQAFINIGVVTSALPNKGLPLPFISYGGSNLLLMLTSVGLLFSIARQAAERGMETNDLGALEQAPVAQLS